MKQFNENWDGVSRKQALTEAAKGGIAIQNGSVVIVNGNFKIHWYRTNKIAEIARDMILAWGKKHGIDFSKGGTDVVNRLVAMRDTGVGAWKELEEIKTKAYEDYNRRVTSKGLKP